MKKLLFALLMLLNVISFHKVYSQDKTYSLFYRGKNISMVFEISPICDSVVNLKQTIFNDNDSLNVLLSPAIMFKNPELSIWGKENKLFIYTSVADVHLNHYKHDVNLIKIERESEICIEGEFKTSSLSKINGVTLWIDYVFENSFIESKVNLISTQDYICNGEKRTFNVYSIDNYNYAKECCALRIDQDDIRLFSDQGNIENHIPFGNFLAFKIVHENAIRIIDEDELMKDTLLLNKDYCILYGDTILSPTFSLTSYLYGDYFDKRHFSNLHDFKILGDTINELKIESDLPDRQDNFGKEYRQSYYLIIDKDIIIYNMEGNWLFFRKIEY